MSRRVQSHRSSEAPMDFEFTSRPNAHIKPVWARTEDDAEPSTPRKRPLQDVNEQGSNTPHFGSNQNVPFIFQAPTPGTPHAWAQPPEPRDVDMTDASPPKATPVPAFVSAVNDDDADADAEPPRAVALGGMKRVLRTRQRRAVGRTRMHDGDDDDGSDSDADELTRRRPITKTTSHHYTLNMPSAAAPKSELPFLLLGYLQFFFNLSLVLVFLYLLLQFILTVQRDVEQKIVEHSMGILQHISLCAANYKNNHCDGNKAPALEAQCATWKTCMDRDATKVGRARVGAELIAEVVNGFVEPISWKTLIFTLSSLAFFTVFINSALSLFRARLQPAPAPPAHAPPTHAPFAPYAPPYLTGPPPDWRTHWRPETEPDAQSRRRRLDSAGAVQRIE